MYGLPAITCLLLAALFAIIGVVQLLAPRFLRDAYARWDYSQAVRVVTGVLDIVAAAMLIDPDLRAWGIGLAAILTFGSVVTLLNHRHYAAAGAAVLMMVALVPAALAVPRADEVRFAAPQRASWPIRDRAFFAEVPGARCARFVDLAAKPPGARCAPFVDLAAKPPGRFGVRKNDKTRILRAPPL